MTTLTRQITASDAIKTALLAIPVVAFIATTFVVGGIPAVNWFRDIIVIRATPLASIASILVMIKVYFYNWIRASISKIRIVAWAITFTTVAGIGLVLGTKDPLYDEAFYHALQIPLSMRYFVVAYSITSLMATYLKPRSIPHIVMIIVQLFVFAAISPIGELVFPPLVEIGKWLHDIPQTGSYLALWTGNYFGMCILVILILLGMERLRGAG
jgi:hypothetical protein